MSTARVMTIIASCSMLAACAPSGGKGFGTLVVVGLAVVGAVAGLLRDRAESRVERKSRELTKTVERHRG